MGHRLAAMWQRTHGPSLKDFRAKVMQRRTVEQHMLDRLQDTTHTSAGEGVNAPA
jgi:hypothetical protein